MVDLSRENDPGGGWFSFLFVEERVIEKKRTNLLIREQSYHLQQSVTTKRLVFFIGNFF